MLSAYSEACGSRTADHIRQFKPRTLSLSRSSSSVISDTLSWPLCKGRMWGVREKPLCKQSPGCCECDVDPSGPTAPVRRVRGHLGAEGEERSWWQLVCTRWLVCVCSCMLLLTQSVTVHPLTTPRSRQCLQMRLWLNTTKIPVPWAEQGCVHTTGLVWTMSCKRLHSSSCIHLYFHQHSLKYMSWSFTESVAPQEIQYFGCTDPAFSVPNTGLSGVFWKLKGCHWFLWHLDRVRGLLWLSDSDW